jgi:transcriptional regulator with XRE-family HTH domain
MTAGQRINKCRKDKKLSQEYVATMLGVSRQAVSKWETDASVPDTVNYINLAKIFGVSVEYLAFGEETAAVVLDDAAKPKVEGEALPDGVEQQKAEEKEKSVLSFLFGMMLFIIGFVALLYTLLFENSLFLVLLSVLFMLLGKKVSLD